MIVEVITPAKVASFLTPQKIGQRMPYYGFAVFAERFPPPGGVSDGTGVALPVLNWGSGPVAFPLGSEFKFGVDPRNGIPIAKVVQPTAFIDQSASPPTNTTYFIICFTEPGETFSAPPSDIVVRGIGALGILPAQVEGFAADGTAATGLSVQIGGVDNGGLVRPAGMLSKVAGTWDAAQSRRSRIVYDSGEVAAGAVINSPIIDLQGFEHVTEIHRNDGAVARAVMLTPYLDDGVTTFGALFQISAANPATSGASMFGLGAFVGPITGFQSIGSFWWRYIQVSMLAGGALAGRLVITGS